MEIDKNAPMFARKETLIHAPLEKVWKIQTDIPRWSEWHTDITEVKLEGELTEGTLFRWKAKGMKIVSTLQTVNIMKQIGWKGQSIGMTAIHNWRFESREGGTFMKTEESLSGWLVRIIKLFNPKFLEKSLEESLKILKDKSEAN